METDCDANALNHIVSVADTASFDRIFLKDGVRLAVFLVFYLPSELLPEEKVDAIARVALLPTELRVLCILADRYVLYGIVVIENLAIDLCIPAKVKTVRL